MPYKLVTNITVESSESLKYGRKALDRYDRTRRAEEPLERVGKALRDAESDNPAALEIAYLKIMSIIPQSAHEDRAALQNIADAIKRAYEEKSGGLEKKAQ